MINEEPSLLEALWHRKWYVAAFAVVAAALTYAVSSLQAPLFEAQGLLLLNDPRTGGITEDLGYFLDPDRYVRNQAEIVESPQVAGLASALLGGDPTPDEIEEAVSATGADDLDAVTISASASTADLAISLVDAVVSAYEETVRASIQGQVDASIGTLEQAKIDIESRITGLEADLADDPDNVSLQAQRNAAVAQLVNIDTRIEQLSTTAALYGSGVQLYVAPDDAPQTQPRPVRNAAIGLALGAIAAGVWAWWRSEQGQRADDRNLPARILDAPLLGIVPEFKEVGASGPMPTITGPDTAAADAYHFAISSLGFALDQSHGKAVVVTSTGPGDGKTVTALNLAVAASVDGRSTLLVDADERARGLTRLARLDREPGLTSLGTVGQPQRLVRDWQLTEKESLDFVPAGPSLDGDTAGYFRSPYFRTHFPNLLEGIDLVVVDTPPLMAAAETVDIAAQSDGVILVVRSGTPIQDLEDAKSRLELTNTPILGYVFNRASSKDGRYGYGSRYGQRYGYGVARG